MAAAPSATPGKPVFNLSSIIENQAVLIEELVAASQTPARGRHTSPRPVRPPQSASFLSPPPAGQSTLSDSASWQLAADDSDAQLAHHRKAINDLHAERDHLAQYGNVCCVIVSGNPATVIYVCVANLR